MKPFFFSSLFVFCSFLVSAQSSVFNNTEHGVVISPRVDSYNDFNFEDIGFQIEAGYFFLKRLGTRWAVSIDARLNFFQDGIYTKADQFNQDFSRIKKRSGNLQFQNISLAIPIKFRFTPSLKVPIYLMVGHSPIFNIADNTTWHYDEFEYDSETDILVSANLDQEEEVPQKFYSRDILQVGVGYKINRLLLDLYWSGGNISLDNDFTKGFDRFSIVFAAHWNIAPKE